MQPLSLSRSERLDFLLLPALTLTRLVTKPLFALRAAQPLPRNV
ncbi:hypothetical protein AVDCRST_MAG94-7241 [uncultured Leptolyngbya sp.]|uniref:Uncharacterized protein n=1 Tax=uncultured Leptolyngbya sp. TaxID=332963 RepID=A0A6J4PY22_9CYAN|nr:hypothetical protein AVDCRST_MAG94-7241 [uncultured Leptolyngbya sp.]